MMDENAIYTLEVPNLLKANIEGFEFLAGFLPKVQENVTKEKELVVDFSNCTSIDGNMAAEESGGRTMLLLTLI